MNALFQQAARIWARWPLPRAAACMVLGYHRVDSDTGDPGLTVQPSTSAGQAAPLAAQREPLPVLDLRDALEQVPAGALRRSVVLTFDDAWADNHTHALGPLGEHRLPATVYVPSRLLGTPGYMSTTQLLEMVAAGVVVGAHSRTHPDLRACSDTELEDEVRGSREDLEDLIGSAVTSFAYPTGFTDQRVRGAVEAAGFRSAVTTKRGWTRAGVDPFGIPRNFVEEFGVATFAAAARGGLNVVGPVDAVKGLLGH